MVIGMYEGLPFKEAYLMRAMLCLERSVSLSLSSCTHITRSCSVGCCKSHKEVCSPQGEPTQREASADGLDCLLSQVDDSTSPEEEDTVEPSNLEKLSELLALVWCMWLCVPCWKDLFLVAVFWSALC